MVKGIQDMKLPSFLVQDGFGGVLFKAHRINLEHLVFFYNQGHSAEMLAEQFPTLELPVIHKAIAFYLENQEEVDRYAERCWKEMDRQRRTAKKGPSMAELRRRFKAKQRAGAL